MTKTLELLGVLKATGIIPCDANTHNKTYKTLYLHLLEATGADRSSINCDLPDSTRDEKIELSLMREIKATDTNKDMSIRSVILYTIAKITATLCLEVLKTDDISKNPAYLLLFKDLLGEKSFRVTMPKYLEKQYIMQIRQVETNDHKKNTDVTFMPFDRYNKSRPLLFYELSMLFAFAKNAVLLTKKETEQIGYNQLDHKALETLEISSRALYRLSRASDIGGPEDLLERIQNQAVNAYQIFTSFHLGVTTRLHLGESSDVEGKIKADLLTLANHTLPASSTLEDHKAIFASQNTRGVLAAIRAMGVKLSQSAVNSFIYKCIDNAEQMETPHPSYLSITLNIWSNIAPQTPLMQKTMGSVELLLEKIRDQIEKMHSASVPMKEDVIAKTCQHLYMTQENLKPVLNSSSRLCSYFLDCAKLATALNPLILDYITITGGNFDSVGSRASDDLLAAELANKVSIDPRKLNHRGGSLSDIYHRITTRREVNRLPSRKN